MKLFLMRHAHSERSIDVVDIQRSLSFDGQVQAEKAATYLKDKKIDKLIVSFVQRTMQTADIIQEQFVIPEIEIITELYEGNIERVIDLLTEQDDKFKNILIIGHNPHIYLIALGLVDKNSKDYEMINEETMTPAKIITLDFGPASSWKEIKDTRAVVADIFNSDE